MARSATGSGILRLATLIAGAQTIALVLYILGIAVASRDSRGSSMTATGWEILVYAMFAALMAWLTWGLWKASPLARTPFLVAQVFAVIIGYTVLAGDGWVTTVAGVALMAVGGVGAIIALSPAMAAALSRD